MNVTPYEADAIEICEVCIVEDRMSWEIAVRQFRDLCGWSLAQCKERLIPRWQHIQQFGLSSATNEGL